MRENDASRVMVSVIVPVYNAEDTLARCIRSVLKQTFSNYELIVVNDGSNDNSGNIIKEYSLNDNRIIPVNQHNKGVSAARNHGVDLAKGQWITFVDADDYITEDCLELAVNAVKDTDCEMIFWNRKDIYQNRIEEKRVFKNDTEKNKFSGKELISKVLYNPEENLDLSSSYCRLFRRDIIMGKHLRFPENLKLGEDVIFMIDYLMSVSKVLRSDFFTYCRTMNSQSVMHRYNPAVKKHMLNLLEHLERQIELTNNKDIRKAYSVYVLRGPVTRVLEGFICHKQNGESYLVRCKQLKDFVAIPIVKDSLDGIAFSELPARLQIKLFCVRHRLLFVLDRWYRNKSYM